MTLTKTKPPRPSLESRRRVGQHHQRNQRYLKAYWPYLPLLGILGVCLVANNWLVQLHRSLDGYATNLTSSALTATTNTSRSSYHESTLDLSPTLSQAAQAKANDMATHNYWSVTSPIGQTPWSLISAAGYGYQATGETLAYGFSSAADTVNGWLATQAQRATMLNATYRDIGFGIANVADYQHHGPATVVVAFYGTPGQATNAVNSLATATPQPVSRLQLLINSTSSQLSVVTLIGMGAALFIATRHSLAWRRALVKGEAFVLSHPMLDVIAISCVGMSMLLTHTAGHVL